MRPFQDLRVWQLAHELTLEVWRLTREFPRHEQWVLVTQMRRSAMSIPGNISEGCGLDTMPQLHRHAVIASGSLSELEYHLLLACDLGYLSSAAHAKLLKQLTELRKILAGFTGWAAG